MSLSQGHYRSRYEPSRLTALVITHRDVNLSTIGRLRKYKELVYSRLYPIVDGLVVLTTCNRFEVYMDVEDVDIVLEELKRALKDHYRYAKLLKGLEVCKHLFQVASGLDSVIIGEPEILDQVRDAWREAKRRAYTTRLLDYVFSRALAVGSRVRRETSISKDFLGYPELAVELALSKVDVFKRVLIVGAGRASRRMIEALCKRGPVDLIVIADRSLDKARRLAEKSCSKDLRAIDLNDIHKISGFDIALIAVDGIEGLNFMEEKARVIVDISTPPVVRRKPNKIFTISDVGELYKDFTKNKAEDISMALKIIDEEVERFKRSLAEREADEAISVVMSVAKKLMALEISRLKSNVRSSSDLDSLLNIAFWSYTKKVLRPLILHLRRIMADGKQDLVKDIVLDYMELEESIGYKVDL